MSHRYVIGDEVCLSFGFFDQLAAGTYGITRLMPSAMDGEPQYRIKGKDGRERVISEGQIARDGQALQARTPSVHNPITEMFNRLNDGR